MAWSASVKRRATSRDCRLGALIVIIELPKDGLAIEIFARASRVAGIEQTLTAVQNVGSKGRIRSVSPVSDVVHAAL